MSQGGGGRPSAPLGDAEPPKTPLGMAEAPGGWLSAA